MSSAITRTLLVIRDAPAKGYLITLRHMLRLIILKSQHRLGKGLEMTFILSDIKTKNESFKSSLKMLGDLNGVTLGVELVSCCRDFLFARHPTADIRPSVCGKRCNTADRP